MNITPITIAVDFDGTCVTHEFPNEGKDIGAVPVLRELVAHGHQLILYTMRSGAHLETALQWFLRNEIKLHGIQYNPEQARWTSSNKCYAQLYIDDAALGCPLVYQPLNLPVDGHNAVVSERPYVDWSAVKILLQAKQILP